MALEALGISRRFMRQSGQANYFYAVKTTDFALQAGQMAVLMGRSGSGKTTFMNMLAGLLTPTDGQVLLDGQSLYDLTDKALSRLRNERMGVIAQGHTALMALTAVENVLFPAHMYGHADGAADRAQALMTALGIWKLRDCRPRELSGGELKRVAIARALINNPQIILADEPTADLDDENTALVLTMLRRRAEEGAAVLVVTHEPDAPQYAHVTYRMTDGQVEPLCATSST